MRLLYATLIAGHVRYNFNPVLRVHLTCICSTFTIVTLALPGSHPSLPQHWWGGRRTYMYAAQQENDLTPLTDIDSPAATAPLWWRSSKQVVKRSDFPIMPRKGSN